MEFSEPQVMDSLHNEGTNTADQARGMVCQAWAHERAPLRNGGTDFYHCWFVDFYIVRTF